MIDVTCNHPGCDEEGAVFYVLEFPDGHFEDRPEGSALYCHLHKDEHANDRPRSKR